MDAQTATRSASGCVRDHRMACGCRPSMARGDGRWAGREGGHRTCTKFCTSRWRPRGAGHYGEGAEDDDLIRSRYSAMALSLVAQNSLNLSGFLSANILMPCIGTID